VVPAGHFAILGGDDLGCRTGLLQRLLRAGQLDLLEAVGHQDCHALAVEGLGHEHASVCLSVTLAECESLEMGPASQPKFALSCRWHFAFSSSDPSWPLNSPPNRSAGCCKASACRRNRRSWSTCRWSRSCRCPI